MEWNIGNKKMWNTWKLNRIDTFLHRSHLRLTESILIHFSFYFEKIFRSEPNTFVCKFNEGTEWLKWFGSSMAVPTPSPPKYRITVPDWNTVFSDWSSVLSIMFELFNEGSSQRFSELIIINQDKNWNELYELNELDLQSFNVWCHTYGNFQRTHGTDLI